MVGTPITLQDLYRARQTIAGLARRTPLVRSALLSSHGQAHVYLKLESLQETGAFKLRGAANKLLRLTPDEKARGVITVSTGNHGRAVAFVGRQLGVRVVICVPEVVLPHKVAAMRALDAEIRVQGQSQDEAEAFALDLARREGLVLVSPFDDRDVIAGQGTIGLELLEDLPDLDTVIVPLSGGGLLGGIAFAVKQASPTIRTVGVSMAKGAVMVASIRAGRPLQLPEETTLADSLMGGIGLQNRYTFDLIRRTVDEYVLLEEEEIAAAMDFALRHEHLVVEGGGAVGVGALLAGKVDVEGRTVAVVVSGGNVDLSTLLAISAAVDLA